VLQRGEAGIGPPAAVGTYPQSHVFESVTAPPVVVCAEAFASRWLNVGPKRASSPLTLSAAADADAGGSRLNGSETIYPPRWSRISLITTEPWDVRGQGMSGDSAPVSVFLSGLLWRHGLRE
jgi:hypothetical protein